jgi:hypothetical protein
VNYDVLIGGVASYELITGNPVHTNEFIVKVNQKAMYAIKDVTVTMRGETLTKDVHYVFDRNSVTILTDMIDGPTGLIEIDIVSGFSLSTMEFTVIAVLLFLALLLLFLLLRRRYKDRDEEKDDL